MEWRERLIAAIGDKARHGKSMSAISREAGMGINYVSQMVKDDTVSPQADTFFKLCAAAEVTPFWVLTGLPPETEVTIRKLTRLNHDQKKAIWAVTEALARI